MAIEHNIITDPNRHEPKGIIAASAGQVYTATGGGTDGGVWGDSLPIGADTATVNQMFVSDGVGGGAWKDGPNIYGEMIVQNNTGLTVLSSATDSTLNLDTDYIKAGTVPGTWSAGALSGVTFSVDELSVTVPGTYKLTFWADLEISNTNTLVAVKFAINNTIPYSLRKLLLQSNSANNVGNVGGSAIIPGLVASDVISLYVAADANTNVTVRESGLILTLMDAV